jgi:hypothetical protein
VGRIRCIKPEFPQSESIGRLSRDARLLFIELWTIADDAGKTRASSRLLASLLFPYDDDAPELMETWLQELESESCIVRYRIEDCVYLQICNFLKHQKIDHPTASRLPEFLESSRMLANNSRSLAPDLDLDLGSRIFTPLASSEKEPHSLPPTVFDLPLITGNDYGVPQKLYDEYVLAYPAISVMGELGKMRTWLLSNPKNKKTKTGITRFMCSWLARAQNNAPVLAGATRSGVTLAPARAWAPVTETTIGAKQ